MSDSENRILDAQEILELDRDVNSVTLTELRRVLASHEALRAALATAETERDAMAEYLFTLDGNDSAAVAVMRARVTALSEQLATAEAERDLANVRATMAEEQGEAWMMRAEAAEARVTALTEANAQLLDALERNLDAAHPLQYGFRDGHAVIGYDEDDDSVVERMNRCPTCEEWSPCLVRERVAAARALLVGEPE